MARGKKSLNLCYRRHLAALILPTQFFPGSTVDYKDIFQVTFQYMQPAVHAHV